MNKYIGKICPFCKTEFKENDDIVLCSSCDMPHHKDCWIENQGCTTFGCMGTIKAADGSANSVTATELAYEAAAGPAIFCTKCGTKNDGNSSYCSSCGNPLRSASAPPVYEQANPANTNPYAYTAQTTAQTQYNQPYQQTSYTPPYQPAQQYTQPYQQQQNAGMHYNQPYQSNNANYYAQSGNAPQGGEIDPDVAALVGQNQAYYLPKFQQMKAQNKSTTWNWVAFFFAPYWFMYRKMYGYGGAAIGASILISLIEIPLLSLLSLAGYIVLGIYANYIYMQWLEQKAVKAKTMPEPTRSEFIRNSGGVSSTALILTIVGWVLLSVIIANL